MDKLAVTQADKDAAARLNGYASWRTWEVLQQHANEWIMLCAQDFARHRIASSQPTQSDALLTKMNKWCKAVAVQWGQGSQTHNIARDAVDIVRAALQEQSNG